METIEHIIQLPATRTHKTPLLFQHGAWHGAWCWQQWMDYFSSLGYEVHAISLPGHGNSSTNKGHINFYTFKDYVQTLAAEVETISPRPVVIGHSLGGAILQKYLESHQLPGAVLLATLPANGLLPMSFRLTKMRPLVTVAGMLRWNLYDWVRTPQLAKDLFLNSETKVDVTAFHQKLVREMTNQFQIFIPFAKANPNRSPVLVIAGSARR